MSVHPSQQQQQARRAICSAVISYFNDFCQTNYLKLYRTDLRQIFSVGRSLAVDDQSEVSFSIPHTE